MSDDYYRQRSALMQKMAESQFGSLSDAEMAFVKRVITPSECACGPSPDPKDTSNDPGLSESGLQMWGPSREVRAEVIRWVCVDVGARALVDPHGIQLLGARITGELDLRFSVIPFPIRFDRCRLTHDLKLQMLHIPALILSGSYSKSIIADSSNITHGVYLDSGCYVIGAVSFVGAHIGGNLVFNGSVFINKGGVAIDLGGIDVGGSVFFQYPFQAEGRVGLVGARVGGDVNCGGGSFSAAGETALGLHRALVKGAIMLSGGSGKFQVNGTVDLRDCASSVFTDEGGRWPEPGHLLLSGFVYQRIEPANVDLRLRWLDRYNSGGPEPYRQLARVLEDSGNSAGAQLVLRRMEAKIAEDTDWVPVQLLKSSIAYGYKPERAIWGLLAVSAVGWSLYRRSHRMGNFVPTEKEAFASQKATGTLPANYPRFNALMCSVENTFPLVKLGQADKWQPDPDPLPSSGKTSSPRFLRWTASPRFMRVFIWIQILLGWLLATLFVAGISGIIRHG